LTHYMVPSAYVQLREFPQTPNGKVDRKALPAPQLSDFPADQQHVAPRDRVEQMLAKLWEDALEVRPVGIHDKFFDIGGTSLRAARLFSDIARTFGRDLPLSTLIQAPTVELLANQIRPKRSSARYPTLVSMGNGGSKSPLFVVHGGAGSTLFLQGLASKMNDRPVYGIEPDGLDGRKFRHATVEAMAAYYLSEIRKVQPAGPYHLGGYCFGGLVAHQMAQQLLLEGERVAAVVMLAAAFRFNPTSPPPPRQANQRPMGLQHRLARLAKSPWHTLMGRYHELSNKFDPLRFAARHKLGLTIPEGLRRRYVMHTLLRAEALYRPQPYPGPIICVHGSKLTRFGPDLGWQGLAAHIEHRVVGDSGYDNRRQLFNMPTVDETARELCAALDAADSKLRVTV